LAIALNLELVLNTSDKSKNKVMK